MRVSGGEPFQFGGIVAHVVDEVGNRSVLESDFRILKDGGKVVGGGGGVQPRHPVPFGQDDGHSLVNEANGFGGFRGGDGSGSWQDDEEALGYLNDLEIEEEKMRSATADCVTEHWNLIEMIAEELLEHTTLIFEELDCLHAIYRDEETEEELKALRNRPMFDSFLQGIAADGLERT